LEKESLQLIASKAALYQAWCFKNLFTCSLACGFGNSCVMRICLKDTRNPEFPGIFGGKPVFI